MYQNEYRFLVDEVVEFSKKFSVSSNLNASIRISAISDIDEAMHLAFDEVYGEEEYSWKDIRELEMSQVWDVYYTLSEDVRPVNLEELLELISENVRNSLNKYDEFYEEIVADLNNCAISRAVNGKDETNFFEKLFEIYKAGGLPCGWQGEYPDGKIVAYLP